MDRDLVADLLPEHLLARAEGPVVGRVLVAGIAAAPVPLVAGILLGALAGCSPGTCPPLVPLLALLAWPTAALVLAAVPVLSALGAFAVLLAGGGALLSGAIVATFSGDLAGAAWQALGSVGVVLYGFGLVIGAARLFVRREPDLPGP